MSYATKRFVSLILVAGFSALLQPVQAQHFGNGATFADGGKSVVFHSFTVRDGNIVELALATGMVRSITEDGRRDRWPSLDPSGKRIAFISQRTPPWKIYTINRDGSDLRLLTEEEGSHLGAAWSPDGSRIVYSKQDLDAESFRADLWIMEANGSHKTKLIEGAMWPSWDSHSNLVFFTTVLADGNVALGSYDMNSKTRAVLTNGTVSATGAGITPDGLHIYVSAVSGDERTLHRMNRDGTNLVNLGIPAQQDSSPRVSPDGQFLLYGYNDGNGTEVYLLNLHTNKSRNLSRELKVAD